MKIAVAALVAIGLAGCTPIKYQRLAKAQPPFAPDCPSAEKRLDYWRNVDVSRFPVSDSTVARINFSLIAALADWRRFCECGS